MVVVVLSSVQAEVLPVLQDAWEAIGEQLPPGVILPAAHFGLTGGWESGDTAATSPNWLDGDPIVLVNISCHPDPKSVLVFLLHHAAHAVSRRTEEDERRQRIEQAAAVDSRLSAGMKISQIVQETGASEGTVYRRRTALVHQAPAVTYNIEAAAGTDSYHSARFRDVAASLGLQVSKRRIAGRGFPVLEETPLARGALTRYKGPLRNLGLLAPDELPAAVVLHVEPADQAGPAPKAGPRYLKCGCEEPPRTIRMAHGPAIQADELANIRCEICGDSFQLIAGALSNPGFPLRANAAMQASPKQCP